ncbi:MAG: serine/threonine protein kinase, partial [Chloroflexota bacterium]|nr:serine/threonine protein kinase [Chloroflexota bacterium]
MAIAQQLIAADRGLWDAERAPIAGRYEVRDEIGAGDAAVVYRALDRLRGRDVVLKVLHPRFGAEPALVEGFRRAMATTSLLDHPSIARVIDYGVVFDSSALDGTAGTAGRPFVVSQLMLGGNLRTTLRERGLLPEAVALTLAARVADALAVAHEAGVIHGDLKPQNVLLDERGRPRVSDFALAHAIGQSSADGSAPGAGTTGADMMRYRSPEQAQGRVVDGRSDLYSLGVLLYELLTGQLPFNGVSMLAVVMRHVQREPGRSREVLPLFSPATGAIILKALAKDPAERYQTAAEMRTALIQVRREAVDATARPASPAESTALLASSAVRQSALDVRDVREIREVRAAEAPPQSVSISSPPLSVARRAAGRPGVRRLAALLSVIGLSLIGSLALAGRLVGDSDGLRRPGSGPSAAPESGSTLAVAPAVVASPAQTELLAPTPLA